MPLGVVVSNRGKDPSIFDSLNPFVEKLVGAYKQSQQNKWDNEWNMEAWDAIDRAEKKNSNSLINNVDQPKEDEDIEGATIFAKEVISEMGMVQKKEVMTGGLNAQATPQTTPVDTGQATDQAQQPELIPDKTQFNTIYKMVSELPTGKVDWSSVKAMFNERIAEGKELGAMAKSFMAQILGEAPTDQRQKFGQDYTLASKIKKERYPETEETGVVFDPNQFKEDNPGLEIKGYNSHTGGYTFGEKDEEKLKFDIKGFNEWVTKSGFVIKGGSVNPTTGSQTFNFGPEPDGKKTFDQAKKEAEQYVADHPELEISNINFTTESVSVRQKSGEDPEPGKSRPNMDKFLYGNSGIINDYIKELIDDGMDLADEDKELVIKNYNLRKHTLTKEEVTEVELIFEQIGIDPNAGPEVILPSGPQSKPKGPITKFGENVKGNVLGLVDMVTGDNKGNEEKVERKDKKDKYGYILGEEKIGNDGKKYKYMGNDEWKPV